MSWDKEDDENYASTNSNSEEESTDPGHPDLVLSPEEAHQYRVAGLGFDRELPSHPFPHAPPPAWKARKKHSKPIRERQILEELSLLSTPLYPPRAAAYRGNLRLQHLSAITAIAHRCLLQGDYIRAGRAWGLLLREEVLGRSIDVRREGKWGIGAEILLRRGRQMADLRSVPNQSGLCFTRQGFEDAKRYYDRLILQHPFRKTSPDMISSIHFYPAMFGLWIYVVQEESKAASDQVLKHLDEWEEESGSDSGDGLRRQNTRLAEIKASEREQAEQVAASMDEILMSPPYSDSPELLELRGMVSLWIGDLFVSSVPQEVKDDRDEEEDDDYDMARDESSPDLFKRREQRLAMEKKDSEVHKSKEFFARAAQRARGITHSLQSFHIDSNNNDSPI